MNLALSFLLFLFSFILFGSKSYSLTEYQLKKFCKKEKKELTCIKNLKDKKSNLQKGNLIEIPVIPYKK